MRLHRLLPLACLAAMLFAACEKAPPSGSAPGTSAVRIAVIPKGTTHVFWKSVEAGARKAGAELGVEILWKGPLKESDRAEQIKIVEQFASEGVTGIVLAPLDDTALRRPVEGAMGKGIPVVIIDSALKGEAGKDFVSYVGTNNRLGGEIAGKELARLLGGKGKVVLLRYQEGSASTMEREEGFLSVMKQNADIQMLVENRFGGATAGEAQTTAMNMLETLRGADGIFCSNESLTFGMLLALRQNNLVGKAKFVGFDTSPPLVEALQKGELHALVAQNPTKMGYEGVKAMMAQQRGEKVPAVVDSGVALVTGANLETPEIKELLGR
jgi:ribose transport system substrate-binding protein